jgi:hypothetical protein
MAQDEIKFGFRSAIRGLILIAIAGATVDASAIRYGTDAGQGLNYNVDGSRGSLTGPSVATFRGVTAGTFNLPGSIHLGDLVVTPSATGVSSHYSDVPFQIQFTAPDYHRVVGTPDVLNGGPVTQYDAQFVLLGHLDGTVQGNGKADLTLTVDRILPGGLFMQTTDRSYLSDLPFSLNSLIAAPNFHLSTAAGGGSLSLDAQVVPEPSTLAFLSVVVAVLVLRRIGRGQA